MPEIVDVEGVPILAPKVGQLLVVQSTIENVDVTDHDFAYIVQIKDKAGVVVHLAFITGTIVEGDTVTPGVSWTPTKAGTYNAEVFVWESLTEPEPLSLVQSMTFTVGS
jgi:hypothetical protein